MKISSINPNFQGRRDNIDAVINLDDKNIRELAYIKTKSENDFKKDRRLASALIYSAPIAAGIAHTVLSEEKDAKIFSKSVKNFAARTANGLKVAGGWAVGLAALDLMGRGLRKLRDKSETYSNFDNNHPFASTILSIAGAFGLLSAVEKGSRMLKDVKAPQFMQDATAKAAKFLNTNKNIKSARKFVSENVAVLPESLKTTGKLTIGLAAPALILAGVFTGIKSAYKANKEYQQNYIELKEAQSQIAKARLRELSVKNDILMQDERNAEDIELIENPTAGLDEEVLAKIDELHEEA